MVNLYTFRVYIYIFMCPKNKLNKMLSRGISLILRTILSLSVIVPSDSGIFDLMLSAEMENVQRIIVPSDHVFFVRLRCTNCHEEHPKPVAICRDMAADGIRGASVNVQVLSSQSCCGSRESKSSRAQNSKRSFYTMFPFR